MVTSVIRHRVADFLKQHAPFDSLRYEDLLELAGSGRVKFHESEEYIYWRGDKKGKLLWVIQQGRVEVWDETPTGNILKDVLGEGDIPALEMVLNEPCRYAVKTATDVILYGIAVEQFESMVSRYQSLQRLLAAQLHFASGANPGRKSWLESELPPLDYLQGRFLELPAGIGAMEAAQRLANSPGGVAALMDDNGLLIATVGAREILRKPLGAALEAAKTLPPALPVKSDVRHAIREMLHSRGDQVALMEAREGETRLSAILTASDLSLFCGHDPVRLIQAIREADTAAQLTPLLRQTIRSVREGVAEPKDVDDCSEIAIEMISALCEACIRQSHQELSAEGFLSATTPFAWVLFGAAARGDVLEPALPALAVLYDDQASNCELMDRMYFAALIGRALSRLHNCGLASEEWEWPEGAQPSMPLSEWKRLYGETIARPLDFDLFARREFFDCVAMGGDAELLRQLQTYIREELHPDSTALALLANDTLAEIPPLTFFRGMVLDMEGTPQQSFDVAHAMIAPLANAARVLALANGRLHPVNTRQRLAAAIEDYPAAEALLREAIDAFRIGLYYRALAGGASIDPTSLGKFDQLLLKTSFASIHRFLEFTVQTFIPSA
jgi:CBS domain-containing protein